MPRRTLTTHVFEVEAARAKPVAVLSPANQVKVIGALIKLDGRSSESPDGDSLTYTWEVVQSPLGSEVTSIVDLEEGGAVISFVPDRTGEYIIGLTVSTSYRSSEQTTAAVEVQAILAPYTMRTTPDGSLMFKVLSSFWRMVEEKQTFSTVWSGYMQAVGADMLRLFQVDFGKSIHTIQSLFQRRWLLHSPGLELDRTKHTGIYGYHQSGVAAFTAAGSVAAVGTIVGAREVILFDGAPTSDAVGEALEVFTSAGAPGNIGTYTINRLNSDASGYIVSAATPFPSPTTEALVAATNLVTFASELEVSSADLSEDFDAKGVIAGDILRIESGADSGYYRIRGVGTADGLANDRTLLLDRPPTVSRSGRAFTVFKALRIFAERTPTASTNTVLIPQTEADLSLYETTGLLGTGQVRSVFELIVEERHVFEALIGQQVLITSGSDGGSLFTVAGLNESKTGYLVSSAFSSTLFPETVSYEIPVVTDISKRLLVLEGRTYSIVSAVLDESSAAVADGGTGPVWVLTLGGAEAPTGREGLSWRIPAVIESAEYSDLEEMGVSSGDLLVLEVVRQDNGRVAELPCYVFGAVGNQVAFDIGTAELEPGVNGELSNETALSLAQELYIPSVQVDPLDENALIITRVAEEVQALLNSRAFRSDYHNLPLSASTPIDLGTFEVRLRTARIVRNSKIPVADTVASVPSLFQFIDAPQFGEDEDGQLFLVGKDGSLAELDREPLELLENRDYTVSSDSSLDGRNLETTAGSGLFRVPSGDLIDRGVEVGDWLEVRSGFDQGRYFVQALRDAETVKAASALGAVPATTASGLQFTILKRKAGNFLRFVDGMFTPELPAPAHLWAQTTLFDASDYIEDNFGALVGVTKEQLDTYGSSQISYKGAVTALMYAWANGPTIRNVTTGCQVLVGLPVTEVAGRIIQIDPDYQEDEGTGRILVEDLDHEGNGTGLVRIYYYPSTPDENTLSDFAGLATNPATGNPFALSDVVHPFQALSRSVLVSDYITSPKWWAVTSRSELQKYHTWQVELDAHQVDSRDMTLIYDFCMGIRPVYTFPHVVLVLYLYDEVTVEDQFTLHPTLFFADEPGFSLESTHMVDSWNGSSLIQRLLDFGSLSTRTLFEGRDLVTVAGSGRVTSARGGFAPALTADPLAHAPDEAVGTLGGINEWFEDDVYIRGAAPVRVGDILFIRTGLNRGRYLVTAVVDDHTLDVDELPGWPPRTRPAADIEEADGQVFQIQRSDDSTILEGEAVVETYDAASDMTVIVGVDDNYRWDGVAVGDMLVVTQGADYGVHRVLQVGKLDGTYVPGGSEAPDEHLESLETHLIIEGELTEAGEFYVRRDSVRTNPLLTAADGTTTLGSDTVTVPSGLGLLGLQYGDLLVPGNGADASKVFKIIDVPDDTTIVLDKAFTAGAAGSLEFVVIREGLFESDGRRDHHHELDISPRDELELTLLEPRSVFATVTDLTLAGNVATSAATDLAAAGVTADMVLAIDPMLGVTTSGVFGLETVVAAAAAASSGFPADEGPVTGAFLVLADDWEVLGTEVVLTGASAMNLEVGDVFTPSTPESATTFSNGSTTVTGALGSTFLSTLVLGAVVRLAADDEFAWAFVAEIVSDTELVLDRPYEGTGGSGALETGVPGGLVRPGDRFVFEVGTFVVKQVQAATMTLTTDTGVAVSTAYTGKVTRTLS